jgi:hypothetical protein
MPIIRAGSTSPWRWWQYASLKRRSTSTRLHGSIFQNTCHLHTHHRENLKSRKCSVPPRLTVTQSGTTTFIHSYLKTSIFISYSSRVLSFLFPSSHTLFHAFISALTLAYCTAEYCQTNNWLSVVESTEYIAWEAACVRQWHYCRTKRLKEQRHKRL